MNKQQPLTYTDAFTLRTFQYVLDNRGLETSGHNTRLSLPYAEGNQSFAFDSENDTQPKTDKLWSAVEWRQFLHPDLSYPLGEVADGEQLYYSRPMLAFRTWYELNSTINPGPGIVPYNSTFWLNGTEHELQAPFLDMGLGCSQYNNYFTGMGNCICFDGEPVTYDWYHDNNMTCIPPKLYIWGFSSYVTFVGLVLELIWIVLALWVRGYTQWWSSLMKHRQVKTAGLIRNVMEVGPALVRYLDGDEVSLEGDLAEKLQRCRRIGYKGEFHENGKLLSLKIVPLNTEDEVEG